MATSRVFRLDITHLQLVRDALKESHFIDADWFDLGLELKLPYPQVKNIEDTYVNNPSRCLRECLSLWLTLSNCTWESLASALERMNQKPAATLIRNTYDDPASQILQHYSDRISQVSLTDSCIQLLYTEGLITEDTQRKIERCGGSLSDTLRELMITVSDDHSKLRSLGNILMELEETKPLAQDIIKDCDHSESFLDPEAGVQDKFIPDVPLAPAVSHNTTESVSSVVQSFIISEGYKSMFNETRGEFGILKHEIVPLVVEKVSSVDDMKLFLVESYPELSQSIKEAASVQEIMSAVKRRCTIIDVSIIKSIVNKYNIKEGKDLVKRYEEKVDSFCEQMSLPFMLDKMFLTESFLTSETVHFVLDWKPEEHTLDDIQRLIKKAFKNLNKRIVVQSIHCGNSIIIICYGPHHLLAALLLEAQDNLTVLMKEFSLIRLTIGHYTVYDKRIRYKVMNNECLAEEIKIADGEKQELRTLLDYKEGSIFEQDKQLNIFRKRKGIVSEQ
ncbi:PREDICTED: uncharacterized protein LOC109583047 [Amphimedon queenslandica]|uniref:Death domain-containing protein n=1 Tax=Amphimedon queenslandica TaxID=400682 RepID=A0AAN0JAS2_AMPQE|nr:PREDICTED: uncharacterized protein LOC109583047 [Amphimedon queenslandica]|eukprot:XP_019853778.1 PREDICTED: uncharacterized protein LOC109583047 [Amphimedon queenslandica]